MTFVNPPTLLEINMMVEAELCLKQNFQGESSELDNLIRKILGICWCLSERLRDCKKSSIDNELRFQGEAVIKSRNNNC